MRGQHDHQAEVVRRRSAKLLGEELDQLGGPEKLALDVDQSLRGAEGAHIGLENAELPAGPRVVDVLGNRANDLELVLPGRRGGSPGLQALPGYLAPAQAEVLSEVG